MNTSNRTPRQASKESRAVREAWENGKEIQVRMPANSPDWIDVGNGQDGCPSFAEPSFEFRIKPGPKMRPWKHCKEVPKCAIYRDKCWEKDSWSLILGVSTEGIEISKPGCVAEISFAEAFKHGEYSLDNGATWLPCGVMEEGK